MRRRPAFAAGFAVVLFVVGQIVALEHEAESRHVTCAEHGEQLEAPDLGGTLDDGCGQAHWVGVEGDSGAEHQDCASARLLRTSTTRSDAPHTVAVIDTIATVEAAPPVIHARATDLILIAPKTSPPRAS
jgi:hypothetical protein